MGLPRSLTSFFDLLPHPCMVVDLQHHVLWANGRARQTFSAEEPCEGRTCFDMIFGLDEPCAACPLAEVVTHGKSLFRSPEPSEGETAFYRAYVPLEDEGEGARVLCLYRGRSASSEIEDALRHSEQRYRSLVEHSPLWILETDMEGKIRYLNPWAIRESGYGADELLGRSILEFIPEEERQEAREMLVRGLSGSHEPIKTRLRMKDGTVKTFLNNSSLVGVESGTPGMIVSAVDISPLMKAERALKQQMNIEGTALKITNLLGRSTAYEEPLQAALEILGRTAGVSRAYVFLMKGEGQRIEKAFEWCEEGQPSAVPLNVEFPVEEFPVWKDVLLSDEPLVIPDTEDIPPGEEVARRLTLDDGVRAGLIVPMFSLGEILGILGLDDTRGPRAWTSSEIQMLRLVAEAIAAFLVRKKGEEEQRRARLAAEAADRAKGVFLANMSHEIRTPLAGIMGMVDLAMDTDLTAEQREYISLAKSSAESLLGLLGGILDLAKIEAGKFDLEVHPFDVRAVVEDTLGPVSLRAQGKGLDVSMRVDPRIPARLMGDERKLRQVLENFNDNAVKFTREGEIVTRVDLKEKDETGVEIAFSVSDTGIGIEASSREKIFSAFTQADESSARRFGGTGLGLTICSQIIEMMGGRIEVEGRPGEGSTFRFDLRLPLAPLPEGHPPAPDLAGTRILVADDHEKNLAFTKELLAFWGSEVGSASGAEEAVRVVREAAEQGRPFDAAFLDGSFPDGDGLDVADALRREKVAPRHMAVMVTGAQRKRDSTRWMTYRGLLRLLKPVRPTALERVVRGMFDQRVPEGRGGRGRIEARTKSLNILLVEDNEVNRKLVSTLLNRVGWRVDAVSDGRRAIERPLDRYDAVLMDIQMPVMDGLEATRRIRRREGNGKSHVPIIAMTAHAMSKDRERCLDAGMDDYISKPLRAEDLLAVIEKWAGVQKEDEGPPPIDEKDVRERLDMDVSLLLDTVKLILDDADVYLESLQEALAGKDAATLASTAHKLKGGAGNIGARPLYCAAQKMEHKALAGDLDEASRLLADVERELERLEAYHRRRKADPEQRGR